MAVTEISFKQKYPQFANVDSTLFADWLAQSALNVSESYFGTLFDLATEYWIAWHLLVLDQGELGTVGPLSSHSTKGGENFSFGDRGDGSNIYHNKFVALRDACYAGGIVV